MRDILFSSFLWGALLLLDAQSWGIVGASETYVINGEVWVVGMASGSTQANISVEWDVCESKGADPALLCTLIGCYTEATPASNSNSSASVSVELIGLGWSWNWTCISVLTELGMAQNGLCSACKSRPGVCGLHGNCYNGKNTYRCKCHTGYDNQHNITTGTCINIDKCTENPSVCSPNANCSNTLLNVDECLENSKICGPNASCSNTMGSYTCQCDAGFIPHPKLEWEKDVTTCKDVNDTLNPGGCKDKLPEQCLLDSLSNLLNDSSTLVLPPQTVKTLLNAALGAVHDLTQKEGEEGLVDLDEVLKITEKLVATLVEPTETNSSVTITTETIEVRTFSIGPNTSLSSIPPLQAKVNLMTIDLLAIAENNNRSAAVVFMTYTNMEDVLKAELFYTENDTIKTMMSNVVTASVVKTKNTTLPKPVNFTLKHQREMHPKGQLTCVYWNESSWSVDGCEATETNATHTVCTCAHLSTFALIMQTDKPPEDDSLLELITMVALSVGLACLALAILTFIFCTWNPKVNNTARLNLSICLFLAHLLLLLVQKFLHLIRPLKLVCSVLAGIQHFLFLSSFVWMYLEALQLFLLVRRLREVKVIHHESVHWGYLLLIGYGVPCLVVSVSAGLFPDGYGNEQCWLKTERGFKWSFLGPVCYVLTMNIILFTGVIGSLRATLADLNREISLMRDTRVMVFKALVQFVILGCPWVLGFFVKNNKMLEYLFILSVSQQGTFIFLVHCVLNKEVRAQYRTWWKRFSGSSDSSSSSVKSSSQSFTR